MWCIYPLRSYINFQSVRYSSNLLWQGKLNRFVQVLMLLICAWQVPHLNLGRRTDILRACSQVPLVSLYRYQYSALNHDVRNPSMNICSPNLILNNLCSCYRSLNNLWSRYPWWESFRHKGYSLVIRSGQTPFLITMRGRCLFLPVPHYMKLQLDIYYEHKSHSSWSLYNFSILLGLPHFFSSLTK